jgi:hypothetical protein
MNATVDIFFPFYLSLDIGDNKKCGPLLFPVVFDTQQPIIIKGEIKMAIRIVKLVKNRTGLNYCVSRFFALDEAKRVEAGMPIACSNTVAAMNLCVSTG